MLVASIIFLILSIICFFIKNGVQQLTWKQIILLSRCKLGKSTDYTPVYISTISECLLLFSMSFFIRYLNDYPVFISIVGGLFIIVIQRVMILFLQKIICRFLAILTSLYRIFD
jgi:hypothetical protein